MSSKLLAKMPIVSLVLDIGTSPSDGYLFVVGRYPYTPQRDAGILIEPPVSDPNPTLTKPAAMAAAVPPLLPPAKSVKSAGFLTGPNK